jgi:Tetratricopeptide repeat
MRPMKFWELLSGFREEPSALREVVSRPEWREPYLRWLDTHSDLVHRQDREVLDAPVPARLSREVARLSAQRFAYSPLLGIVRASWPDGGRDPGPLEELTALEVHDRFGGWVIEEVGEYGSMQVTPSQVHDEVPVAPPQPPPRPAPPPPQPTKAELEAEIHRLQRMLDANPRDHNARHALANALVRTDRSKEAIPHLLVIADFYWNDGFMTSARGYLRRAGRIDASHPDVLARQEEWGG